MSSYNIWFSARRFLWVSIIIILWRTGEDYIPDLSSPQLYQYGLHFIIFKVSQLYMLYIGANHKSDN